MVFLNYSTMQMVAKIVYYGPGLCGKTTNLKEIYRKTSPRSRGEMVSLETETDRTLFFDLLPMDVGVVGGFKTKFQLYTVPGQVFYNSTRKLVLRGVDGIVFVADSQQPMLEANRNSFDNLLENLEQLNLDVNDIPLVFQYNKRDLPNVLPIETLNESLNQLNRPYTEASALRGVGVFETLREISKLTLVKLKVKALDGEPKNEPVQLADNQEKERIKEEIQLEAQSGAVSADEDLDETLVAGEESVDNPSLDMPETVSFEDTGEIRFEDEESEGLPSLEESSDTMVIGADGKIMDDDDDLGDFDLDFAEDGEIELDDEEDTIGGQTPLDSSIDLDDVDNEQAEPMMEAEEDAESTQPLPVYSADDASASEEPTDVADFPEFTEEDDFEAPSDTMVISPIMDDALDPEESLDSADFDDSIDSVDLEDATEAEVEPFIEEAEIAEPVVEPQVMAVPEPAPDPEPSQEVAIPEPTPTKNKGLSNSLQELESLASQAINTKSFKTRKSDSVDDLLGSLTKDKTKVKMEKARIVSPRDFSNAQFNCVLLDEDDNVVHTHLLKVTPQEVSAGKFRVRLTLDIEVE